MKYKAASKYITSFYSLVSHSLSILGLMSIVVRFIVVSTLSISLCSFATGADAQNNAIDSLKTLIKISKVDTTKVNLLNQLFSKAYSQSPEAAFPFAEEAFNLSEKINYALGKAQALQNKAIYFKANHQLDKSIDCYLKSIDLLKNTDGSIELINAMINVAALYKLEHQYDKAMAYYLDALKIAENQPSGNGRDAKTENNEIFKKLQARIYLNIGKIYQVQVNHNEALKNFSTALSLYSGVDDSKGVADAAMSMGIAYYDRTPHDDSQTFVLKGEHKEASEYVKKAKKIYEKINDFNGIVHANNYLAYISAGQGEFGLGVQYAQEGLKVAKESGNEEMEASINGTLGDIYFAQGNYRKALEYLDKCYEGAQQVNNKGYMRDLYLSYASIYYKLKDYQKAYEYQKKYADLKDELQNTKSTQQIAEMNARFESEKKDKELIKKDAELAQQQVLGKQQEFQRNALIGFIFLIIIVGFFIYRGYRNNKIANISIRKQKEEIEQSYQNVALLSEIVKEITSSLSIETIIEKVYENVNKMMSADVFCIGVHNEANNSIDFPGFLERGKKYDSSYNLNDEFHLPVVCFKNNREIFINELEKEYQNYIPFIPEPVKGDKPESIIYLPLISKDKIIGVICVESFNKNAYSNYHLNILRNLAAYVAIALDNAQLYKSLEERIQLRTAEVIKQKEEVEKSYDNIKLLSQIGREISSVLSIDEIVQKVYENVNKIMDASVFGIGIYDYQHSRIEQAFIENGKKLPYHYYSLTEEFRPAVWCFKKQQKIVINDFAKEYNVYFPNSPLPQPIQGEKTESLVYLPLTTGDKYIGVITVQSFRKNAYSPYLVDLLRNLAVYLSNALENARLYKNMEEQVKHRTQEVFKQKEELEVSYNNIHVLSEIGQQLTSMLDFEDIFVKLHQSVSRLMPAESFGVRIYHPETETIEIKYEYDKGERLEPFTFSTINNENNYSVWCVKNRKEIFINDNANEYSKYVKDIVVINGEMTHSLMFCPMIFKENVLGVITVQSYAKNKYTSHHLDILRTLANYTAIAFENAQLYENLETKVEERTVEVIRQKEEIEKSHANTQLMSDIGREITSILSVEEIVKKVYESVNRLMDAPALGLGIFNELENRIEFAGFIEKGEKLPFFFMELTDKSRPAVWCFSNQQEIVINDLQKEYNNYFPDSEIPTPKEGEQSESIIYLPLSIKEKHIGVITVQSFVKNAYSDYQLNMLRNLALYMANALENARLYENMEDEVRARTVEIERQNEKLARLSIVASETDNGVLIFNADGEIEYINEGFTRLQGFTLDDLKENKSTIQKMSNNPEIQAVIDECIEHKKSLSYKCINITKYGREIWVQSSLTPIVNEEGEIQNWVVIDVDISDLKKAEDSIRLQNEKITDSITYAQKIQETLLPSMEEVNKYLPDSFVLYKPKDIVSGDFYWIHKANKKIFIAVADCTGHGVPGAFMSLMGNNLLNDIIKVRGMENPAHILDELNIQILTTLNQNSKNTSVKYGMDIALICLEPPNNTQQADTLGNGWILNYAGAHNPLLIYRNNECIQIKANKRSIGSYKRDDEPDFINHTFHLETNDMIYLFSDGFADQIGGPENKKMFAQPFREILASVATDKVAIQYEKLEKILVNWQGKHTQTDDVLILGIHI